MKKVMKFEMYKPSDSNQYTPGLTNPNADVMF